MNNLQRILVADDEEAHLDILCKHLNSANYEVIAVKSGEEALQALHSDESIKVVLLDRMMPGMSGMDVFRHMKKEEALKRKPVIFQTALDDEHQIQEGIDEGAFYYLTKPFDREDVLPLVNNAMKHTKLITRIEDDCKGLERGHKSYEHMRKSMTRMIDGNFKIRTTKGALHVAYILGNCFTKPRKSAIGLHELMTNAVEHGNLKIPKEQKYDWLLEGSYDENINSMVDLNADDEEYALVSCKRDGKKITVTIEDNGKGFDYGQGTEFNASTATLPDGRGIYIASKAFDDVIYSGAGNIVTCTGEAALIH